MGKEHFTTSYLSGLTYLPTQQFSFYISLSLALTQLSLFVSLFFFLNLINCLLPLALPFLAYFLLWNTISGSF